jgi:hypothetical protein
LEALSILFGAAFTVAVAYALGALLLRGAAPAPVEFIAGAALLSGAVFAIAALRLAYPATFLIVGVAALAGFWRLPGTPSKDSKNPMPRWVTWTLGAAFLAYFALYFFNAMAPEVSPDGAAYHLGLVSRYFRIHGLERITTNLYASLSQGMEMLFLFAYAFGRHSAAAMVHFAFLVALAWSMVSYGRRAGFPALGGCAALLVFASPGVGIDGISAYNDVALAAVAFALFYLLQMWAEEPRPRVLLAIGLLAGFAYAIKYTGGLAVPYAIGCVAWSARRKQWWKPAAIVALGAAFMIVPWMVKNWLWVHNPVAPFGNAIFPNPYVMVSFEKEYRQSLTLYGLKSRWELPLQVTTRGLLSGLLGPVFLLAPIALLSLRRREGRQLLLAALVFGGLYFTNVGARFLIPPLPFVALAMMLALAGTPALAYAIAALHIVLSWPSVMPKYCDPGAWRLLRAPWKYALRLRPAEDYLEERCTHYGVDRLIEQATEPGSTVFTFTPIPEAYTSRRILVAYESAENKISGTIQWTPVVPEYAPTWRLKFAFPRQPLRGVRVVQTGSGTRDLWNIHELRIWDGARELERGSRWRITANPYPWGIQRAFDNSLLTFWMCGEWARPGQYVAVDFGAPETADTLVIETAPNQWGVKLKLEGRDESGGWKLLAPAPEAGNAPRPLGLRRAAAEELKRRGIGYLLVFDSDLGSGEIARTADSWGMRLVGEYRQAKLYKIL